MQMQYYPDDLLNNYKSYMLDLFKGDLVGIYLTGSLAFGEFFQGKSDVDCTVIIRSPLDIARVDILKKIHQDISKEYKNTLLQSQYITPDNIGKSETDTLPFYSYDGAELSLGMFNASAVTWYTLKNHGITVFGAPAGELDISTSVYDVKAYVKDNVNSYWRNWLDEARSPFSQKRSSALTNWAIEWCVCGISRMYYTMVEGDITSKCRAVEYGLTCLPGSTHKILKEALRIRSGDKDALYTSRYTRRRDMIEYMDHVIELIQNMPL